MQNSNKKLLLFNMDESKVALIRTLCANLNVKLIKIYRYRGEDFTMEMMILCGFKPDELDAFLQAYREMGIPPVWLKATVTPHNLNWSAAQLYRELAEEHRQLHG